MRKYYIPLVTLALFVLEWLMLNQLMVLVEPKKHPMQSVWMHSGISYVLPVWFPNAWTVFVLPLVLCSIPLINHFRFKRKKKKAPDESIPVSFLQTFIRIIKAEVGTLNGIVSALFILFNLAWTQDLLLEAIKGEGSWFYPLFTAMFLVVPFLWNQGRKTNQEKVRPEKRKFLIAAMSFNALKYNENNEYSSPLMSKREGYEGWFFNSEPIRACFFKYPNLERVLLIQSTESHKQSNVDHIAFIEESFNRSRPMQKESITSLTELISKSVPSKPEVKEEIISDVNVFNNFFPILKRVVNGNIKTYGYSDEEVLFSITGATSVFTAGLVFLSMPGNRGCVYFRQDKRDGPPEDPLENALDEFDVNIYSIDELWNEIVEQASGE